jgi:AcrR family transcriptional regulator
MSRGALYHYFDSKEAILRELLVALVRERLAAVSEAAIASNDPRERLAHLIRTMVRANAASVAQQIVLLNDLQFLQRRDRAQIVRMQNEVVQITADAIAALDTGDRIGPANLKACTMMLMGMINYTYLWYDPAGPVTPDAYAEMVCTTFFDGLLA